jgi:hypothetical protein
LAIIPPAGSPFCKNDIANRCIFHLILVSFVFLHKFACAFSNSPDCPKGDHEHTPAHIKPVFPPYCSPSSISPSQGGSLNKPFSPYFLLYHTIITTLAGGLVNGTNSCHPAIITFLLI